jgi:hypothetical protein
LTFAGRDGFTVEAEKQNIECLIIMWPALSPLLALWASDDLERLEFSWAIETELM